MSCLVCNSSKLTAVADKTWDLFADESRHDSLELELEIEKLVEKAAKELKIKLTKSEIQSIGYHVITGK